MSKSSLTPSQSIFFLGMQFNMRTQRISLPMGKVLHLRSLVTLLLQKPQHTVRLCMKVLGVMVSTIEAVPFAQFHLRKLQWNILTTWKWKSLLQDIPTLVAKAHTPHDRYENHIGASSQRMQVCLAWEQFSKDAQHSERGTQKKRNCP